MVVVAVVVAVVRYPDSGGCVPDFNLISPRFVWSEGIFRIVVGHAPPSLSNNPDFDNMNCFYSIFLQVVASFLIIVETKNSQSST